MNIMEFLKNKFTNRSIIFPEGQERNIIHAAYLARQKGICRPWLVGDNRVIGQVCATLDIPAEGWYTGMSPEEDDLSGCIAQLTAEGMNESVAEFLLNQPLYYAAMMVRTGKADAMVAGFVAESGEVINAAAMMVGLAEGVSSPSSYFLFEIPDFLGREGNMLVYADCGLQIEPTEEQLADIAVLTARSVHNLLGWEPRVAMLSFSTKGSAEHPRSERVQNALAIARQKAPRLLIDGEMQADAALSMNVAEKKIPGGSPVAGQANILIFPDLDAGNIAYKLTQRLTGGTAYGPILQGFKKPVCDLSRGSSVEDILGVTSIAAVMQCL